eukprot:TRINITY_DN1206_c0_g1_i3.p1 TRINITY_DN1206_c0_g1~~TRINITY_DN1206_c0_g1_i3.p1  ORF type:complete len:218 (+),score=17.99 TRINITY_DN1206_c0_g1_i3:69-722(+)
MLALSVVSVTICHFPVITATEGADISLEAVNGTSFLQVLSGSFADTENKPVFDKWELDYLTDGEPNTTIESDRGSNTTAWTRAGDVSNNSTKTMCVTRADPRAEPRHHRYINSVSPVGTPCVFGADPRDEGSHCIMTDGENYGSFGWCYTAKDASSWGSCSEVCPLSGQAKILGSRIEDLEAQVTSLQHSLENTTEAYNETGSQQSNANASQPKIAS